MTFPSMVPEEELSAVDDVEADDAEADDSSGEELWLSDNELPSWQEIKNAERATQLKANKPFFILYTLLEIVISKFKRSESDYKILF